MQLVQNPAIRTGPNYPVLRLLIPLQNLINWLFCGSLVTQEFRATREPMNWSMSEQLLRPWALTLSFLYPIAALEPGSGNGHKRNFTANGSFPRQHNLLKKLQLHKR